MLNKPIKIWLFLGILLLIVICLARVKDNFGSVTERGFLLHRKTNLKALYQVVVRHIKSPRNSLGLYDAVSKNNDYYLCFTPGTKADMGILDQDQEKISRNTFYKFCEYSLIKDDLGWWALIEHKYGKSGKFFLMITKDGKIIKIDKAFLPEQLKFEAK